MPVDFAKPGAPARQMALHRIDSQIEESGDVDQRFAEHVLQDDDAALQDGKLNLLVTEELRNGVAVVQLHLDPERDGEPFNELPGLTILRGVAGSTPQAEKAALRWTSADTLEAEIPLRGN